MLEERFPDSRPIALAPPAGFPAHDVGLGLTTVFTELRRRPALREHLWPEDVLEDREDFQPAFRRREQRRELLSAMARLGAAYVDLYLLAIGRIGSFKLGQRRETESATELAVDFVALLERQKGEPGSRSSPAPAGLRVCSAPTRSRCPIGNVSTAISKVLWRGLCEHHPIKLVSGSRHLRCGELRVGPAELAGTGVRDTAAYGRMQHFTIGLRSQVAGDEILIECESKVGLVDLQADAVVDALTDALDGGGAVKLCVDPRVGKHQDRIYVRRDILFDPDSTRLADVRAMFGSTLFPAARLHAALEDAGLIGTSVD